MSEIKTALISVSDKKGIEEFARELQELGVKIISTGGTYKKIKEAGLKVIPIEEFTNFPEIMDGRVKTLHPKIHGGILAVRNNALHQKQMKENSIEGIDLVAVNLYPFKETIAKNSPLEECIENIDIGGPTLIRAAAKNYEDVTVIVDPQDYERVIKELKENKKVLLETKRILAAKAFQLIAEYDALIAQYLNREFLQEEFPEKIALTYEKMQECRYGENPHQKGFVYREPITKESDIVNAKILWGKEMSFNNFLDAHSSIELLKEFEEPTAVIVKHNNPCGVASSKELSEAFQKAYECDPVSAFGGIIALNRPLDLKTAEKIISFFNEAVIAPGFEEKALELIKTKKNLRILELNLNSKKIKGMEFKKISGGLLLEDKDSHEMKKEELKFVSQKKPSEKEIGELLYAWKIVKHIKSNAIVVTKEKAAIGIGIGQTNRVLSARIALEQAGEKARNAVIASDGFFPFKDSIELAGKFGIKAVIEPGGSLNDKEVIEEADRQGIALVFTGIRHFKH